MGISNYRIISKITRISNREPDEYNSGHMSTRIIGGKSNKKKISPQIQGPTNRIINEHLTKKKSGLISNSQRVINYMLKLFNKL